MRVYVGGARKGSGWFKGKRGKRRKIISRRRWSIRIQGRFVEEVVGDVVGDG